MRLIRGLASSSASAWACFCSDFRAQVERRLSLPKNKVVCGSIQRVQVPHVQSVGFTQSLQCFFGTRGAVTHFVSEGLCGHHPVRVGPLAGSQPRAVGLGGRAFGGP